MTEGTFGTEVTQALDAALAAYQRHYGRARAIERLQLMLARAEEAQRVTDETFERIGTVVRRAAE